MLFFCLLLVAGAAHAVQEKVATSKCYLDVYALNEPQYKVPFNYDIYQNPILVVAPTQGDGEQLPQLVAYYAINGLRSVRELGHFQPLYQLLLSKSHLSGLLLTQRDLQGNQFLFNHVRSVVLPENFKVSDFLHGQHFPSVPILYVAPKELFNNYHFVGLNQIFRFAISDSSVDFVPLQHGSQLGFYNGGDPFFYDLPQRGYSPFGLNPFQYQDNYNSFSNQQHSTYTPINDLQLGNVPVSDYKPQYQEDQGSASPTKYNQQSNDNLQPNYNPTSNLQQNKPILYNLNAGGKL